MPYLNDEAALKAESILFDKSTTGTLVCHLRPKGHQVNMVVCPKSGDSLIYVYDGEKKLRSYIAVTAEEIILVINQKEKSKLSDLISDVKVFADQNYLQVIQ